MKKFSIANSKGGVGKTTCTLGIVNLISKLGKKILVFDLDPQGNLTNTIQAAPVENSKLGIWFKKDSTAFELLETFVETENENIVLVPAWSELANKVLTELDQNAFGITIFMKNLEKVEETLSEIFEYIVFDTSPKADKILTSMLLACDSIIVPIEPHIYSYEGLDVMLKPYEEAILSINSFGGKMQNNIKGYFVNKVRKARFHETMLELITNSAIKGKLLDTMIPDTIGRQQETISNKYKITDKNPFYNLFTELLEKGIL